MVQARTRPAWGPRGGLIGGIIALVVIAVIVVLIIAAIDWLGDDDAGTLGISVPELLANPSEYYDDDDVTVSGEVNRILSPIAYTIGGEDFGNQELLIIGPPPAAVSGRTTEDELIVQDDIVQVVGELEEFELASVEDEVDADLDDNVFAEFAGQPVLLAQGSVVTPRFPAAQGEPLSVEEVLEAPEEWTDESVTVTAEVVRILSPNLYIIRGEDEGSEIAMVDATGSVTENAAAEADTIQVTGPIAFFDLETVEVRAGIDLDDAAANEIADGSPTIIGEVIRIIS